MKLLAAVSLVVALAACAAPSQTLPPPSLPATGLTIFAAASLGPAMDSAAATFASENAGVTISQSNGSSVALRTQIEQGAPADLFLSADTGNPQAIADAGLTAAPPTVFARNALAIVVPAGNPRGLTGAADLATPGLRIVAAGEAVPITGYATTLLNNLAALPEFPDDLPAAYAANVVSHEEDVRAVLAKVQLGEADAAIVYATDAASTDEVAAVAFPDSAQPRVEYSGVVLTASSNQQLATEFLAWLAGADGQQVLARFGFLAP